MPHLSSPIAYPPSSSPPAVVESRKRRILGDHAYPLKRRSQSGNERSKEPLGGSLGSSILYKRPLEANKENVPTPLPTGPFLDDDDEDEPSVTGSSLQVPRLHPDSPQLEASKCIATGHQSRDLASNLPRAKTSQGIAFNIGVKEKHTQIPYEKLIGERSISAPGEAKKSFYGIDIHHLLDQAAEEPKHVEQAALNRPQPSTELPSLGKNSRRGRRQLWTEKYRAKKFTDLVGDDRTHRDVLRWLKGWDPVVFPGSTKPKPVHKFQEDNQEPKLHRKILMLTGPPGLGKTTLAHVCARQAGYEVLEINASDERSRDVVKGRIKDCVGTDNVKGINTKTDDGNVRKTGRPFCVVVDEVDGVVGGSSGGGEGGFIKALIDLVMLDQRNAAVSSNGNENSKAKKKGDKFRLLRPMILICNDVYHPSLRPLRATTIAELIRIRKPPLEKIVARLGSVFDKEGVPCDKDGVRRLCEATWGLTNKRERTSQSSGTGEGDMRSILVVGEWVASKLRQSAESASRLTKKWVEGNLLDNLSYGGGGARGLGRGGAKEAVERVFQDGAGFAKSELAATGLTNGPKSEMGDALGVSQSTKYSAMQRLQEIVDASGESDRIITDCFSAYPSHQFQDDTFLSKPNAAYDWLHFHDRLSSKVHSGQEWELGAYLSQPALGLHHLFASPAKQFGCSEQRRWDDDAEEEPAPFSGPRADYEASEAMKQNKAILLSLQSSISIPLQRSFRSIADISTDLLPNIIKMLNPDVKPIFVGGSGDQRGVVSVRKEGEREMIHRAVSVMSAVGVTFERSRVDAGQASVSTYVYRMEPPLDTLTTCETISRAGPTPPARYAIRQALDQEHQKFLIRQSNDARQARFNAGRALGDEDDTGTLDAASKGREGNDAAAAGKAKLMAPKRDFFGREVVAEAFGPLMADGGGESGEQSQVGGGKRQMTKEEGEAEGRRVWVSYHEGFSNAVRKPVTLEELLRSF